MKLVRKSWKFASFWVERNELRELSIFFSSGAKRVSGVVFLVFHSKIREKKAVAFELVQLTNYEQFNIQWVNISHTHEA